MTRSAKSSAEDVLMHDELLDVLNALASPHRIAILAALTNGRNYVSQLAREVQLSRPLVHMHLKKLEDAGLIAGDLELSETGKAMKYYEVRPFEIRLTPALIAEAASRSASEKTGDRGS